MSDSRRDRNRGKYDLEVLVALMMFWIWGQKKVSSRMCPKIFAGAIRLVMQPSVGPPLMRLALILP